MQVSHLLFWSFSSSSVSSISSGSSGLSLFGSSSSSFRSWSSLVFFKPSWYLEGKKGKYVSERADCGASVPEFLEEGTWVLPRMTQFLWFHTTGKSWGTLLNSYMAHVSTISPHSQVILPVYVIGDTLTGEKWETGSLDWVSLQNIQ